MFMAVDEQAVLNRLFALTESIGKTESSLASTSQSLDKISKKLDDVVVNQEKLLQLQAAQEKAIKEVTEQDTIHYVDNKNRTKELFRKCDDLEDRVSKIEGHLKSNQTKEQRKLEETKESIKGKWAFWAATIGGLITGLTAIILALIK